MQTRYKLIEEEYNKCLQKCRDKQKEVYLCFIDYIKVFNGIKHKKFLSIIERRGLDSQDLKIIQKLYEHEVVSVKLEDTQTKKIPIKRRVRQAFLFFSFLFRQALCFSICTLN